MASVKRYIPRAKVMNADGSVTELVGSEALSTQYAAYRVMKEWREIYGDRLRAREIEVRGAKRKLYTIHIDGKA